MTRVAISFFSKLLYQVKEREERGGMTSVAPKKRTAATAGKKLTPRRSPAAPENRPADPAEAPDVIMELPLDISSRLQAKEHYIQTREAPQERMLRGRWPRPNETQEASPGPMRSRSCATKNDQPHQPSGHFAAKQMI